MVNTVHCVVYKRLIYHSSVHYDSKNRSRTNIVCQNQQLSTYQQSIYMQWDLHALCITHIHNYAYSIQKFSGTQMQYLVKDTELPGRSRGAAPFVDLPFLTVFTKVVVYAITQRMLELAVKKLKLQVCLKCMWELRMHRKNLWKCNQLILLLTVDSVCSRNCPPLVIYYVY